MFHIKEARKVTDKLDTRHFFASLTLARQNDGENRTDGSRPLITTMPLLHTKLRKEILIGYLKCTMLQTAKCIHKI